MSEYELVRLDNIKKNEEFLRNLELSSIKETLTAESRTISRSPSSACHARKKRKTLACGDGTIQSAPLRRSTRGFAGVELLGGGIDSVTSIPRIKREMPVRSSFTDEGDERIQISADALRIFIEESSALHFEQLTDEV